ncbi:unnamed protein product [Dovyalis caffra]|uniref:NAC domain-containing protein n=1 Tax=Dovyalis caffra TaxID=77055 RepID=A0AAV1SWL0_9ROSI|nr:unnamed protein product [Dovyalis caffra]
MAIAATMSHNNNNDENNIGHDNNNKDDDDDHEHDMVMPGFRFHPTEEELVEFYLRRKVEGKRFNVELIAFLDLYRYDPWELPVLSKKDLLLGLLARVESFCAEISLCRVYKRAGVEDHPSLPRSLPSRASSSRGPQSEKKHQSTHLMVERFHPFVGQSSSSQQIEMEKMSETDASSSSDVPTALGLSKHNINAYHPIPPISTSLGLPASVEEGMFLNQSKSLVPNCTNLFTVTSSMSSNPVDDLHRLVNYQQASISHHHHQDQQQQQQQQQFYLLQPPQHQPSQLSSMAPQSQPLHLSMLPNMLPTTFQDRLWEWNQMPDSNRDYNNPFK